jgi:hypothetical protein
LSHTAIGAVGLAGATDSLVSHFNEVVAGADGKSISRASISTLADSKSLFIFVKFALIITIESSHASDDVSDDIVAIYKN